jgi:putative hydroxymethylpyrimidine transport system ATP-binding protein
MTPLPRPQLPASAPALAAPGIEITAARLDYGGVALFDNLSLSLPAGLWTCLLGPSGVGKTTLLRLIAGLEGGAAGIVAAGDGAPLDGRIAYMAQQDLLLPWLTLAENVALGARLRGTLGPRILKEARELLGKVGLNEYADMRPDACSGGMRQRAALARTLIEDRPVVLMDEPFSALDAITRLRLQDIAAELLSGRTVLLVTHDPLEALRLGDRVRVMAGRPALLGEPLDLPGHPPRRADDPATIARHAELLARLAAASDPDPGAGE